MHGDYKNEQTRFWFNYDLDRNITHPKFNLTAIRTHDLQIMNITLHDPEAPPP